jgi:hypothetical protein
LFISNKKVGSDRREGNEQAAGNTAGRQTDHAEGNNVVGRGRYGTRNHSHREIICQNASREEWEREVRLEGRGRSRDINIAMPHNRRRHTA